MHLIGEIYAHMRGHDAPLCVLLVSEEEEKAQTLQMPADDEDASSFLLF